MRTTLLCIALSLTLPLAACEGKKEAKPAAAKPVAAKPAPAKPAPAATPAPAPAPAAPAGGMTMLDHLQAVNGVICPVLAKAAPGKTAEQCVTQMNGIAGANPMNKTIKVDKAASDKCLAALKGIEGPEIMMKTTQGDCALDLLRAK